MPSRDKHHKAPPEPFLTAPGEMAARIAAFDWSSSLGPPAGWPQSLKTFVGFMIHSPIAQVLLWGEDGIMIYNDAYSRFAGRRHPQLLGSKVREGWPEVADFNDNVMKVGLAGGTLSYKNQVLMLDRSLDRSGTLEPAWLDLEYSAVPDESGKPGGVVAIVVEITERVQAEARRDALVKLTEVLRDADDPAHIQYEASKLLGEVLGTHRVGYGTIDPVAETLTVRRDWTAPGVETLAGTLALRHYGSFIDSLKAGDFIAITDVDKDPRTRDAADALKGRSAHSFVNEPVIERGQLVAVLFINHGTAREWTNDELVLVREFAARIRDATERLFAARAVRTSEAQFRVLAQAMPNHVWTSPPNGELDWFNDQVYAYSGYKPGELDGTGWGAMVHPDDIPSAVVQWTKALSSGETYQTEFRLRRYDGTFRWHLARAIALRGADGTIIRWIGTNTDVDDQKNAEALLETRLEQRTAERDRIWQVSQDMLVVADSLGVWQSVNPAWTRILGWTENELVGRSSEWLEHPDDIAATRAEVERLATGRISYDFVNRFRARDGSYRTLSWSAVPMDDRLYAVARDVTEQRAQAAALAQTEEQLRQAQKMEAVGQLTGGIAHDFNNLLQGITGALDRVQHRLANGRTGDIDRFLKAAVEAANRAAALTHRLLAFSRRQTLDPRPTDVNRLISGMEDLIRRTMGPNIAVEVIGAGGLWPAKIDAPQLESALLNLCINARDAMPDGGNLTVETANKWLDEHAARERDLVPGQYISVCATDTGTGMTPEVVARAFDPFFTTKPLGQGTGLGLSMIYGFVRQSGGQVRVYSEVGKGTTMCLYFPRFVGTADEIVSAQEEVVERGFGESVLVVDDDATVRMLVAEVLTEQRYHVLEAADGPAALRIVESGARIDLMITDVGLPGGMNGRQVADTARLLRRDLKVLFITGYAENAAIGNGHLDHGMAILTKPFAMSTMGNKVREMLET